MDACFTVELWFKMHRFALLSLLERWANGRKPPTCGDHVPPGSKGCCDWFYPSNQKLPFPPWVEMTRNGALATLLAPPHLFRLPTLICNQLLRVLLAITGGALFFFTLLPGLFSPSLLSNSSPFLADLWLMARSWPERWRLIIGQSWRTREGTQAVAADGGVDANKHRRDWGDHSDEKIKRR